MKHTYFGLIILLFSSSVWATATPLQIKRAQDVLKQFVFPQQILQLPAEKLKTHLEEVTYQALREGDILRMAVDPKEFFQRTGRDYVDNKIEGFMYDGQKVELHKGDYIRILRAHKSSDVGFNSKEDFKGIEGSTVENIDFMITKLDEKLEPIGKSFSLVVRGGLDRKVTDFLRFDSGFFRQNPLLSFSRAGVNDVIVSAESVKTKKGLIPAYTAAIITKIVRTRIPWTISNYDYVFTLHLLNCPLEFQMQKCNVDIQGTKMYSDPSWAHYTMPENRREIKFLGTTLMY